MSVEIKVDIEDTLKGLDLLDSNIQKGIVIAIRKSALTIEGQAKINAPVDTGRLRASIFSEISPMIATVMPTVDYAIYVHEGTKYMQARPFLRDAVEEKQDEITDIFEKEINNAVDKFN